MCIEGLLGRVIENIKRLSVQQRGWAPKILRIKSYDNISEIDKRWEENIDILI